MKLKHWRGFPAIFARIGAPLLGFALLVLANHALSTPAQLPKNRLHVAVSAAYGLDPLQVHEWDLRAGETFQFSILASDAVPMKCRLMVANATTAALSCDYRRNASAAWQKAFSVEPALGKCKDAVFEADSRRRISLAICITAGSGARPPLSS